jgi:hypothetical protein
MPRKGIEIVRDEFFDLFVAQMGEANSRVDVPTASIEKWRGKLPDQLLAYWQEEGWSCYTDGLFWTVNPDEYEDLVDEWLEGTQFEQIDAFHAIARTAFGKLFLCGEATGLSVTISCTLNSIFSVPSDLKHKSARDLNAEVQSFFLGREKKNCDMVDEHGKRLFPDALGKLGALEADEMYGFEPALVLGGSVLPENLRKVKLDQHLTILRQFAAPHVPDMDVEKLLKLAGEKIRKTPKVELGAKIETGKVCPQTGLWEPATGTKALLLRAGENVPSAQVAKKLTAIQKMKGELDYEYMPTVWTLREYKDK